MKPPAVHGHKHRSQFARIDWSPAAAEGYPLVVAAAGSAALRTPNTMTRWEAEERAGAGEHAGKPRDPLWDTEGVSFYVAHPVEELEFRLALPPSLADVRPYVRCERRRGFPDFRISEYGDADIPPRTPFDIDADMEAEGPRAPMLWRSTPPAQAGESEFLIRLGHGIAGAAFLRRSIVPWAQHISGAGVIKPVANPHARGMRCIFSLPDEHGEAQGRRRRLRPGPRHWNRPSGRPGRAGAGCAMRCDGSGRSVHLPAQSPDQPGLHG
jgi:hypothetical protein